MRKVELPLKFYHAVNALFYLTGMTFGIVVWIWSIHSLIINDSLKKIPYEVQAQEVKTVHYLSDAELSTLYSFKEEVINDTCLSFSVEDSELLMKIAVLEDHTDAESQAYVMKAILNRVESEDFPNTIKEVVEQKHNGKYQFSSVTKLDKAVPDTNSHLALAMIESGEIESDALYFEAKSAKGTWQSKHREYLFTVGASKYYR